MSQRMDWRIFENSLKTEGRIFNRMQVNDLTPIFDSIGALQSRDGYPLVVDAGRGTNFHISYQVFQSDDNFECKCIPTNSGSPRLAIRTRLNEGRPS